MSQRVAVSHVAETYSKYVFLLRSLGFEVDRKALTGRLLDGLAAPSAGLLDAGADPAAKAPPELVGRVSELYQDLGDRIAGTLKILRDLFNGKALDEDRISKELAAASRARRARLGTDLASSPHAACATREEMPVEEFHLLLRDYARGQSIARTKLIEHLRAEFETRGIEMSFDAIEERFRSNTKVRSIPACVHEIFRGLGDGFRTGLVPIEEMVGDRDVQEWLDETRDTLRFRSDSAMHKALAEATGLKYDAVHKALSGKKKARRIQLSISETLHGWLSETEAGRDIDVAPEHRAAPAEALRRVLPDLLKRFRSKEAVYRQLSRSVGIKPGSVRRYFQSLGTVKSVPLPLYQAARRLAAGGPSREPRSYLENPRTRRVAFNLAEKAGTVLREWQKDHDNGDLEAEFKDLRRALIRILKEQRASA
jgi:hypothetical protein